MSVERKCEECGAELPANAPQGLCPRCLMRAALPAVPGDTSSTQPLVECRTAAKSLPGRVHYFGDYELIDEIARGGMGIVYKARQISLQRLVAVKMLPFGAFASDDSVRRFRAEAEAAASLQHPNIVAIHEVGEHEGQQYFSMDYIEGQTLAQRAQDNPLPPDLAADYVGTVARAIHFAHLRGVVHRDLKPSNVLIDALDQPRITDFGLAKRLQRSPGMTQSGLIMGTPNYMAPEQASGRNGEVGPAADIYSLGAILYFVLTGRAPILAETAESAVQSVLSSEPIAPRSLRPGIPRDLETICLKCLEKEPKRRYASALELAFDLERWRNHEPILARPNTHWDRLVKWMKRKPGVAALSLALLMLLIVVALGSTAAAFRIDRGRRALAEAHSETTAQLWEAYLAQANARRLNGSPGRFFEAMETIAKAAKIRPALQLRNEAIACMALDDLRFIPLGETNAPNPGQIIFDPELEVFARTTAEGNIVAGSLSHKAQIATIPCRHLGVRWLQAMSQSGRYVVFHTDRTNNCVWDLQTREMIFEGLALEGVALSPVEDLLATVNTNGSISTFHLDSRQAVCLSVRASPGAWAASFDWTGSRLACFSSRARSLEVLDLNTKRLLVSNTVPGICEALVWSPDGKRLAAGCQDARVYILDAESGNVLKTCIGHGDSVLRAAFNAAGTRLATMSWDGTIRLWDPFAGIQLLSYSGWSYQLQFSRDGQFLGYIVQGSRFGLLEAATHQAYQFFCVADGQSGSGSPSISPDGRWAGMVVQGRARFLDVRSGCELGTLPELGCASFLMTADGKSLITCGTLGVAEWPIQYKTGTATDTVRIGPRRAMGNADDPAVVGLSVDPESRNLAVVRAQGGAVRLLDFSNDGAEVFRNHVSVSSDGKWIATGVRVRDAQSGQTVHQFGALHGARVLFSPNSRWLLTLTPNEARLWRSGTWGPGPPLVFARQSPLTGVMAFSQNSRMAAITHGDRVVRLLETETGRLLADLEAPTVSLLKGLCFNVAGTLLLATDGFGQVHVWNLRFIRERLAEMNLDWDTPPYAPEQKVSRMREIRMEVIAQGTEEENAAL